MKVQNINVPDQGAPAMRGADTRAQTEASQLVFRRTLSDISGEQRAQRLAELTQAIDAQAERLTGRMDISEFEKYRKLIKNFVDDVVSNGYSFSKDTAFASRGRHRFFATVKTIDEKLDAMAKELLSGQADNLKVLDGVGEIRGLILDMLL